VEPLQEQMEAVLVPLPLEEHTMASGLEGRTKESDAQQEEHTMVFELQHIVSLLLVLLELSGPSAGEQLPLSSFWAKETSNGQNVRGVLELLG